MQNDVTLQQIAVLEEIYTTIKNACGGNLQAYRIEFHQDDYFHIRDALNLHGYYLGKHNVIKKKKCGQND